MKIPPSRPRLKWQEGEKNVEKTGKKAKRKKDLQERGLNEELDERGVWKNDLGRVVEKGGSEKEFRKGFARRSQEWRLVTGWERGLEKRLEY